MQVEDIHTVSARCFVISFRCPEIAASGQAGQFVMISASQHLEPLLRRPMALYQLLREDDELVGFSLLVEAMGQGTRLMAKARPGDHFHVLGPLGKGFQVPVGAAAAGEQLLIMGGVGAAPFPFLAHTMTQQHDLAVRAFIGGRTATDLLCIDEFEGLGVPVELSTEDGSSGRAGLVTEPLECYLGSAETTPTAIYSCGPTAMMQAVDRIARAAGLPHQVSLEAPMACGFGVCLSCVVRLHEGTSWSYGRICREGPVFDSQQLAWT